MATANLEYVHSVVQDGGSRVNIRRLPEWWERFVESYPAVPTIIAVTGLGLIMFMLAPTVAHPSDNGGMIDSLAVIVRSGPILRNTIALRTSYHEWVPEEVRQYAREIVFNPTLYFVVPFFLLLEYLFPCDASQQLWGKGFLQDAVWFAAAAPTRVLLLGAASQFLQSVYDKHLAFLTISSAANWPRFLQVAAALLVLEFLWWMTHLIRHKVLPFWYFHAVHHSQKELNTFTEDRVHFVDILTASVLMFIPFYIFQVPNLYAVAVVGLYRSIHSRFLHANVKINLGWLGWVIASPQFHRVHHSADPAHFDKNYGVVLSVFDYMFGTGHRTRDIYPETGIDDDQFPTENNTRLLGLAENWVRQTTFPFVQLFTRLATRLFSYESKLEESNVKQ
jgi:lathosterol oxidase